jgi:tetratricopeptide (TPR) repeat protein
MPNRSAEWCMVRGNGACSLSNRRQSMTCTGAVLQYRIHRVCASDKGDVLAALDAEGSSVIAHFAHSNRSLCFIKTLRFTEALHEADCAIALKPEWAKGWGRKAAALHALGRMRESLTAAQRALSLDQGNGEYRALALALQEATREQQAPPSPTHTQTPPHTPAHTPAHTSGRSCTARPTRLEYLRYADICAYADAC